MSRIAALILSVLISVDVTTLSEQSKQAHPPDLPQAIEFVRPSVVQVVALLRANPNPAQPFAMPVTPIKIPLGTGFLVNEDGYVITARHVAEAIQQIQFDGQKHLEVALAFPNVENYKASGGEMISIRGAFTLFESRVVEEDARHDLALLKLENNPFGCNVPAIISGGPGLLHKAAVLSPTRPREGERIAVSGYPFGSPVLVTTSGNLASAWTDDTEYVQVPGAPQGFKMPDVADSYLADMHVNPGNSGGAVYSVEDEAVIGVCVAFHTAPVMNGDQIAGPLSYNSGISIVVPIPYAIDLLKKHNLKGTELSH
jgi:S1-C subfamily serine protease